MRPPRYGRLLSALLLCITLLHPLARAHRPDYELLEWQENKFWWWSSNAPMTKALDEIPEVVSATSTILEHFARVERRILANLEDQGQNNADSLLKPCQSPERWRWRRAIRSNFGVRGFPDPDVSCITDFSGVRFSRKQKAPYTVDQLYEAALRRGLAIKANIRTIASRFIDVETNYTNPDFVVNYPYEAPAATCVLHPSDAARVGDHWRLGTAVHNRPILHGLPLFGRRNIVEFARVVDGHLTDNLLMRLPVRPENGTDRVFRNDTTTLIATGRGQATPSMFRFTPPEQNPAILEILNKASTSIYQTEIAVLPSSIAVMILPLVLNIIPISLFAHVSIVKMLIYVLLSDILTAIPLLLRGLELLRINARRYRSVVTRLSSAGDVTRSEAAGGEMWAVECRVGRRTRTLGIILLSLSVGFLIGGIVLELAARAILQRQRKRLRKLAESRMKSSVPGKQENDAGPSHGNDEKAGPAEPSPDNRAQLVSRDPDAGGVGSDRIERSEKDSNLRRRKGRQVS